MLQLPGSGVRRIGVAVLLAGASCSAPDSSGLFGPSSPSISSEASSPDASTDPGPSDEANDAPTNAPTSGGELPGVSSGEGSPIPGGLEPPESTNSGDGSLEPVVLPADAGVSIVDPSVDAGVGAQPTDPTETPEPSEPTGPTDPSDPSTPPEDPGPSEPPAPPDTAEPCGGRAVAGACWYLTATSQSCDDVCATRGGVSAASNAVVGTPEQGGSIEGCDAVLQAFGAPPGVVNEGFREDALGFGCHVFIDPDGTATAWWLTAPEPSPDVSDPSVRMVCGCAR
ncbi:MAG TPA: hypothetical protein VMG12_14025 [Polyangiaceae bacterium]|nr:hypothetical protein [Polyangiaceae bacterium]